MVIFGVCVGVVISHFISHVEWSSEFDKETENGQQQSIVTGC